MAHIRLGWLGLHNNHHLKIARPKCMKNIVQILEEYIQHALGQYCQHSLILWAYNGYLWHYHKEKVNILMNLEKHHANISVNLNVHFNKLHVNISVNFIIKLREYHITTREYHSESHEYHTINV